jgi:hypothetical protein
MVDRLPSFVDKGGACQTARVTFGTFARDQRSAQFVNARLPLRLIPRPAIGAALDRSRAAVGTVGGHASNGRRMRLPKTSPQIAVFLAQGD